MGRSGTVTPQERLRLADNRGLVHIPLQRVLKLVCLTFRKRALRSGNATLASESDIFVVPHALFIQPFQDALLLLPKP